MCRLFAALAPHPIKLTVAFEALSHLSREHKDGWGIARFDGAAPQIERGLEPAHDSARFAQLREGLASRHCLAHLRLASVGDVVEGNAHPFCADRWVFMHNGTVHRFKAQAERLEALIHPRWRRAFRGETDSERCFGLFLTRTEGLREPTLLDLARIIAEVMQTIASICDQRLEGFSSAMNFLVSDGQRVLASRRGRPLFHGVEGHARLISSEPLYEGPRWCEVPEDSVAAIDEALELHVWSLSELRSR
jgi:predicted glutamine amidotransferase